MILLAILLPFSIHKVPKLGMPALLFLLSVFLVSRIHFNMVFNGSATPVIDSTFSTMSLFIPLSIITATGVTGITNLMPAKLSTLTIFIIGILILVNIDIPNTFYAHPCCDYLQQGDLDAISWIKTIRKTRSDIIVRSSMDYLMGVFAGVGFRC